MAHRLPKALWVLFLFFSTAVPAQQVQWASKVLAVSSSNMQILFEQQYAAQQALGAPSIMPGFGSSFCAWSPSVDDAEKEYIHVGFDAPQKAQMVVIHENYNPGSVWVVELFDTGGEVYRVYENNAVTPAAEVTGKITHIRFPLTTYPVASVRIVMKTSLVPGANQIDAIGISDGAADFVPAIHTDPAVTETVTPVQLGPEVNSPTAELLPVISPDGGTLYFTRQDHPDNYAPTSNQDIWYSERKPDGTFGPAKNLGAPLSTTDNNAMCSITPDGNTALLLNVFKPDGTSEKGISVSHKKGGQWQFPEKVEMKDFYNDNMYGEYFLVPDGRTMILTIQRKDGLGSKDLHVSFLQEDGTWTAPLNMGSTLNTAASEATPFLAADGVTLYFSTSGHPGFGKNDMFLTRRLDDTWTNWTKPVNLGPGLNNPAWNAYYTIPASGDKAFFVSYVDQNAEIFQVDLPKSLRPAPVVLVRGVVTDRTTGKPVEAKIEYENLTTGVAAGFAQSGPDGKYSIVLPGGNTYGFVATAQGYASVSDNLDIKKLDTYQEIERNLQVVSLEVGGIIRMNNVFFDVDKAVLRPGSFPELKRVARLLKERATLSIEIGGHTDSDGDDAHNLDLSKRRAKAVYDYLVNECKVEAARLQHKGYGESAPQVPNTSTANKQLNRRVEFKILGL